MIIDVHGHVGGLDARVFSLDQMARYLDACAVERVLVSSLDAVSHHPGARNLEETAANTSCLDACRQDGRLVPLYWVRLGHVDSNVHAFAGAIDIEPFAGAVSFPHEDMRPEIWDAETGRIRSATEHTVEDGQVVIPVELGANDSTFVVFVERGRG